ncbi:MAG TPA: hypothetical protein VF299_03615 [Mycobacterium sp.]
MSRLRLVRPSLWRVLWSIIVATVVCCVIAGIAMYIGSIVSVQGTTPMPDGGEYVLMAIWCLTLYGPSFLIIAWPISVPVIIALGVAVASIRRGTAVQHAGDDAGDLPGQPMAGPAPDSG